MFRYYILLFIRNISRQKLFSAINLLGLTAGIVSALMIYLYVDHEFSFDRFHKNASRIYRINQTFIWGEHDDKQFASLGPGVAYAIKADIPEAEEVTRIFPPGNFLVKAERKIKTETFDEGNVLMADSNFFKVFTYEILSGNPETALQKPQSIVLTQTTAKKYFGTDDALGKLLRFKNEQGEETGEVTAVIKDVPDNSYLQFDMLISLSSIPRVKSSNDQWLWTAFETFVLLDKNASPENFKTKIAALPAKHAGPTLQRFMSQRYDEYIKSGKKWDLFVQPLTDIHLYSTEIYNRASEVGSAKTVYILIGVQIFIILLSCINFMNLATAQYTRRIKESSLRKILGSGRYQLIFSFFSEAFLFCVIASLLALVIVQVLLPFYNVFTDSHLKLDIFSRADFMLVLVGLVVVMSLLSGSYPSIFLNRFEPVQALKGKFQTGRQGKMLRHGLVSFQFFISMALIVCTVVVFQQIKFLNSKDIGFNRENLLVLNRVENIGDQKNFTKSLNNISGIEQATLCSAVPPHIYDGDQFRAKGADNITPLNYVKADENYLSTLGLQLKAGRNFSADAPADKTHIIINETAAKAFGWRADESVLGKKIEYPGNGEFEIIGLVRDFNYWALQSPIQPMAIFNNESNVFSVGKKFTALRLQTNDAATFNSTIAAIQNSWRTFAGDNPFQYQFVDDAFERYLQSEQKFGQVLMVFAALAILIAGFGLLGMIIYTLEQRTKEIGIRKVVGASVLNIWALILKEYIYLIAVAIVVSTPCCILFLNNWLQDFNYHITISPWLFVVAGACLVSIAIVISGYFVIKAALSNPVEVLKDE